MPYAYGNYQFLLGYLFSGILGSVASYLNMLYFGRHNLAIGASTAIYGVFVWGRLYSAHLCNHHEKDFRTKRNAALFMFVSELALAIGNATDESRWIIYVLIYLYNRDNEQALQNFFMLFFLDNVDHMGHAGGALGGIIMFYTMTPGHKMRLPIVDIIESKVLETVHDFKIPVTVARNRTVDTPIKEEKKSSRILRPLCEDLLILLIGLVVVTVAIMWVEKLDLVPEIAFEDYFEGVLGDKDLDLL